MDPTQRLPLRTAGLFSVLIALFARGSPSQEDAGLRAQVEDLVAQLDDPKTIDRAAGRLVVMGERAVPVLVRYLDPDESPALCADIAWVLGRMGERGVGAVDALVEAFEVCRYPVARESLAWAIGEVGPFGRDAAGTLRRVADQRGLRGASFALEVALARLALGARPSASELERALSGQANERMAAVRVIALGHPAGRDLLPRLVQVLPAASGHAALPAGPEWAGEFLVAVAEAVVAVAPESEEALEASAYLLRHRDPRVRALAMARISADASSTLPWLQWWHHALADRSSAVLREALSGADRHGDLSLLLVPRIKALRESTHREIRLMAAPRLRALLEQLSPLGRQMYALTTCPQRELKEREEKLARALLEAGDDAALATLQAMPHYFANYLGNDEVAQSARRVLVRLRTLSSK